MSGYAHPDTLVTTDWVADHLDDPQVALVEVNVDHELYDQGHVPGAVGWSWRSQLCDTVRRDILSREAFEALMRRSGIGNDTTVVLYGDSNNWFAAWAFWQMKVYGHDDVRMMDGGRKKWEAEGRPMTSEVSAPAPTAYVTPEADATVRAFLDDVRSEVAGGSVELVDVRSPAEFSGEVLAPPGLPETCQRGGHIPGASNIPWSKAVDDETGTFRSRDELAGIYGAAGITGEKPIITYCRIGERSSHSWFVLRYLLGYDRIRNYDGSWTEWGNLVGAPVETGASARRAAPRPRAGGRRPGPARAHPRRPGRTAGAGARPTGFRSLGIARGGARGRIGSRRRLDWR
jgi:thiosulfate/3-mercaptopyruvate sulfurtransferase